MKYGSITAKCATISQHEKSKEKQSKNRKEISRYKLFIYLCVFFSLACVLLSRHWTTCVSNDYCSKASLYNSLNLFRSGHKLLFQTIRFQYEIREPLVLLVWDIAIKPSVVIGDNWSYLGLVWKYSLAVLWKIRRSTNCCYRQRVRRDFCRVRSWHSFVIKTILWCWLSYQIQNKIVCQNFSWKHCYQCCYIRRNTILEISIQS